MLEDGRGKTVRQGVRLREQYRATWNGEGETHGERGEVTMR